MYNLKMRTYTIKCAEPPPGGAAITTVDAAGFALAALLINEDNDREHFAALFCNTQHQVIAGRVIFSGGTAETPVYVSAICRAALLLGASRVFVAHNHPSGNLTPSPADFAVEKKLLEALKILEIGLLDSFIVAPSGKFRRMGDAS
jgi:DNA repair protein RadC